MRKHRGFTAPDYYHGATYRPHSIPHYLGQDVAYDMDRHWLTAPEWLAWLRRKGGASEKVWNGSRWHYPVRPQVHRLCWIGSTFKVRRLP